MMWLCLACTLLTLALSMAAMLFEFDSAMGYFNAKAPLFYASQIIPWAFLAFCAIFVFTMKKTEHFPVLNYGSNVFRFSAGMVGFLSLLSAYAEISSLGRLNDSQTPELASRQRIFVIIGVVFALVSFGVYMAYLLGRNEKKSTARAALGAAGVIHVTMRIIENEVARGFAPNHSIKTMIQLAQIAVALALLYTFKCELPIKKSGGRARTFYMLVCPVFSLGFALPLVAAYYLRIFTNFDVLVDSVYAVFLSFVVLASSLPARKARPMVAAELAELKAAEAQAAAIQAQQEAMRSMPKKCPSCGAYSAGDVCEYCGSPLK